MTDQITETWGFLRGVPPIEEFLSFVLQASAGKDPDLGAASERWRSAADAFNALTQVEAGAADGHRVDPLPEEHTARGADFLQSPEVRATYLTVPAALGLVPLDGLVVFQRQINLRYTSELQALIEGSPLESEELFNFCLSINQPDQPINAIQASQNTFVFSSASTDARFLEARLLDAGHLGGHIPAGRPTAGIVLYVGYGVNAINVLNVGGRLILNNGSHRAFALRAAGVTHAIAVVQTIGRPDELALVPQVQANKEFYLESARPPMLKDYFNADLFEPIESPRRVRQIRVQFGMEQSDAPG